MGPPLPDTLLDLVTQIYTFVLLLLAYCWAGTSKPC